MDDKALVIKRLTTGYTSGKGEVVVSTELDAGLLRGSFTCLLGVNGAGKSTLLRTLAGFQVPLTGTIEIDGRELSLLSRKELSRKLSIVLTDRPTLANMTATDLVGLGRAPYTGFWGTLSHADNLAIEEALRLVGARGLAKRNVATLSDGEFQKVMIAKALAQDTPIIFLDEPTAFLDYPGKIEIMRLLRRLAHGEGKTILLSTHDLPLALQTADSLWLLDRRHGLVEGMPEDIVDNGSLARYFNRDDVVFDAGTKKFTIPE